VRSLQDVTTNVRAARARPCVYTQTPVASLAAGTVQLFKNSGVPLVEDAAVFKEALAAVAPGIGPDPRWCDDSDMQLPGNVPLLRAAYLKDETVRTESGSVAIHLVPESLLATVFPEPWVDRQVLRSAFAGDRFVKPETKLTSPYAAAAEELKRDRPGDPNLVFLEAVDDVIEKLPPRIAALYVDALMERIKSPITLSPDETAVMPSYSRALPRAGNMKPVDSMLYLALTGRLDIDVPRHIAVAASSLYFKWPDALDGLRDMGRAEMDVPEIPPTGVRLYHVAVNDAHELVVKGPKGETVLARGWTARDVPILEDMKAAPTREAWAEPPEAEALMRVGMRMVWLDSEGPPGDLPMRRGGLVRLDTLAKDIAKCLDVFRPLAAAPGEIEKRREAWCGACSSSDAEIVRRLAEGLLAEFAPWPDPYSLRDESDDSWSWPSSKCVKSVMELFKTLANAPIRAEPPDLVATFLYLIAKAAPVCHAWPTGIREGWQFKLKTDADAWITGTIWRAPGAAAGSRAAEPLVVGDADFSGRVSLRSGDVECVIRASS